MGRPVLTADDRIAIARGRGSSGQSTLDRQNQLIRCMEKEGLKLHKQRKRKRDAARFRGHLVDLTTRLDELTSLHAEHSGALLRDSQETSVKIAEAGSSLARAEVDIYESLSRKGWPGGGLDEPLDKGVDLFANDLDGSHGDGTNLFSILSPRSILPESSSDQLQHRRGGSMLTDGEHYQSLTRAVTREGDDTVSIFSERMTTEGHFNKSRGVRQFYPLPLLRKLDAQREGPRTLLMEEDEEAEEAAEKSAAVTDSGAEYEDDDDDDAATVTQGGIGREQGRDGDGMYVVLGESP